MGAAGATGAPAADGSVGYAYQGRSWPLPAGSKRGADALAKRPASQAPSYSLVTLSWKTAMDVSPTVMPQ